MQAIITDIVNAHYLEKMRQLLAYEELATWRRMNGFNRVVEGEENWFHGHRSLPPTPEQYTASLRFKLQKLKDEISVPNEEFARPKRSVEKRGREAEELQKKKMAEFRSDSLDELLANFQFARIKEYVEKRSRKEAQAQVTVTPVDTVQHCSPCSPNPDMPPDVCFRLENNEGKMGPELKELESPSAGTGLETPGQLCPPNEGTWDQRRTTASGILTPGVGSSQGTREKYGNGCRHLFDSCNPGKPQAQDIWRTQNKQFDPGGEGEKAPPWNAAVTLLSFLGESWEAPCLFSVCALSVLYVCSVS